MNAQRFPNLAPGMIPDLARRRTSSGCILRNWAASIRFKVFMGIQPLIKISMTA